MYNILKLKVMWQKNYTNVFTYAAGCDRYFEERMNELGKQKKTTFFSDLGIAEWYGEGSVKETYENVVSSWLDNYEFFTEFVLALNWKSWYWYTRDDKLSQLYARLCNKATDAFYAHYKENKKACDHFYEMTD